MSDEESNEREYGLAMPFWIDTDAYTKRDREMFVCGVEFEMVYRELKAGGPVTRTIHKENESRIRMMCGKMKRKCTMKHAAEGWTFLEIAP